MGGAVSSTSKVAVVAPSRRPGIHVDYTFFQIGVNEASVAKNVNCGNISSCIGPFAIEEGLVRPQEPYTAVRIYNTNTGKVMEQRVRVERGQVAVYGDARIAGVPGTGAEIRVSFLEPEGSVTGRLFPSGNRMDVFRIPGGRAVQGTLVDAGTAAVFVQAENLGLKGTELLELNEDKALLLKLEAIRGQAAVLCGLVQDWREAGSMNPAVPDIVLVGKPEQYSALHGEVVEREQMDLTARCFCMGAMHRAFPVTTAIALCAAASAPGTAVSMVLEPGGLDGQAIRIGHVSGVLPIEIEAQGGVLKSAACIRTARRIMEGILYVR